jgi:hypothetical protein
MRVATALAGIVLVLVPVAAEPAWAYPVAVAGLIGALITLWPQHGLNAARRLQAAIRRRRAAGHGDSAAGAQETPAAGAAGHAIGPPGLEAPSGTVAAVGGVREVAGTAAAVAAIAGCAASRLDTAAMAGEGLLLLVFVLLLGRPAGLAGGTTRAWLRLRLPTVLAAVAATGIVLAALAAVPGSSPWLALGGLAAAVVAYLVAAPRDRSGGSPPG